MSDLSYTLFDSLSTGAAAFDTLLFQVSQGADATHTEDFTNMRGAGSLPSSEKMTVNKVGFTFSPAITPADIASLLSASILQLRLYDQVVLYIPLVSAVINSGYVGFNNLAAGAGLQASGLMGDGYELANPIEIPGGAKFAARVKTTVATVASTKCVVSLFGVLSIP